MLKRVSVTILGLSMSFLVVNCAPRSHGAKPKSVVAPAPGDGVPAEVKCSAEPAKAASGQGTWLAQLPAVIRFEFREDEKEGLVAEPTCVRDAEHTPDWDDVVKSSFFGTDSLEVDYGRSVLQLESTARFAKFQKLILERRGRVWTGKSREVLKRDGIFDALLEALGHIERDIELPSCEAEQMRVTPVPPPAKVEPTCS